MVSEITARFSVEQCVKPAGSPVCQATETHSVFVVRRCTFSSAVQIPENKFLDGISKDLREAHVHTHVMAVCVN